MCVQHIAPLNTVVVKLECYARSFDRRSGPGRRASMHYLVMLERPAFRDSKLHVDQGLTLYNEQDGPRRGRDTSCEQIRIRRHLVSSFDCQVSPSQELHSSY